MKFKVSIKLLFSTSLNTLFLILLLSVTTLWAQQKRFNIEKDLLLAHFDSKTDVDDIHTMAAFATLLAHDDFSELKYHAVTGTYGIQEGLYVPSHELLNLAFDSNWSDAHNTFSKALNEVTLLAERTLKEGGDVWIAEAGQSDFSAQLVDILNKKGFEHIHIVQHSDWNESVTSPKYLKFVKEQTDYHKIPDGNALGNGSPGFRSEEPVDWQSKLTDEKLISIWEMALKIGNNYNGQEGRYLNEAIAKGGLDFSDLSEVCYILNLTDIADADAFFSYFMH